MFILCLKNGTVIPVATCQARGAILHAISSIKVSCRIPIDQIQQAWEIAVTEKFAVENLKGYTHLAAAVLDLESALLRYQETNPDDAFVTAEGAIIFGAAALTLSVIPERTSDDIDVALSQKFLLWADEHWRDQGHTLMDLMDVSIFRHAGFWRERTSKLIATSYSFRLLHSFDVMVQKLLRRDQERFQEKDIPDIQKIISALNPPKETLSTLLKENYSRYIPDSRDRVVPSQYEAVVRNTDWFLRTFLPETNLDTIIENAQRREYSILSRARLLPDATHEPRRLSDVIPLIRSSHFKGGEDHPAA